MAKKTSSLKNIDELTDQIAYMEAKIAFLKQNFSDIQVKIHKNGIRFVDTYCSEQVNNTYTNLDFVKRYYSLIVMPYSLLEFTYKNKTEQIKVNSNPMTSRLAYINYSSIYEKPTINHTIRKVKSVIKQLNFSKVVVNFKNNNFNESMINQCRLKILEMIQENPNLKLNTKHLDDRLKKLMAFT